MTAVSLIITNYNQGHLIERAIKSAFNQDHSQLEIIVVDDGSTDHSIGVIKQYKKDIEIIQKENGGTASARNAGIQAATHNVFAFLDADDEYMVNKVSASVKELERYDDTGIIYSDYIEIMQDGSKKLVFKPPFDKAMLFHSCIVSTNPIISKMVFEKIGLYDETTWGMEDYDLYLRTTNANLMIRHIGEPLFYYYNHGENKTLTADPKRWQAEEKKIKERAISGEYLVDTCKE